MDRPNLCHHTVNSVVKSIIADIVHEIEEDLANKTKMVMDQKVDKSKR